MKHDNSIDESEKKKEIGRSLFSCCCRLLLLLAKNQLSRCNFIFSIFFDDVVASHILERKNIDRRTRHSVPHVY
jgi:hypothetical protein